MKKSFLLVVLTILSGQALADHWVELDANYSLGRSSENFYDDKFSLEFDDYSYRAQIYTGSISSELAPIDEAGFLSKKSSFYLENDVMHYVFRANGQDSRFHSRTMSFGGSAVIKDFTVGGNVKSMSAGGEKYGEIYNFTAGYYVTDSALVSGGVGRVVDLSDCSDCETDDDEDLSGNYLTVLYHQVFSLKNDKAFSLDSHWEKATGGHRYGAEGTYYFSTKMGLTLGLEKNSGGGHSDTDKFVKYHLYLNENIGMNASYTDSESYGLDDDNVGLVSIGVSVNI